MAILAVLFLVVPLAELYVIIQVGQSIGALNTIGVLILVSMVGAWLAKREGISVIRRIQQQLDRGQMPGNELVDGFLVLFAGAMLLTPGFLSDCLAILLLIPPVRVGFRRVVRNWFAKRVDIRYR